MDGMDVYNSTISSIKNVIKDLDELCASVNLSLTTLQAKLDQLPSKSMSVPSIRITMMSIPFSIRHVRIKMLH